MNKKRLLSINLISLNKKYSFEDKISRLFKAGIPASAVWFEEIQNTGLDKTKEILKKYPIKIVMGAYVGPFNQNSEEEYLAAREADLQKIRIADELGIDTILALTGPLNGLAHKDAVKLLKDGLRMISNKIKKDGMNIKIALEPIHYMYQKDWTYISTIEESLEIINELDEPAIGLMIDIYHIWQEPAILDWLEKAGKKIFGCQLSDWRSITRSLYDRVLMGDGCIPIKMIISTVEKTGWNEWYDIEIFSDELWELDAVVFIERCKNKYRQIWQ